jgi:glycosyltransferase involved in cell wall biosynthesis
MSLTVVCTNVLSNVNSLAYGSHCQEWYRMGRTTSDNFILFHPDRFSIDNARNQAAKIALEQNADYIYFLDDDMVLTPNTYSSLKKANADVAQALTFIRGMPFEPMFFKNLGTEERINLTYYRDYEGMIDLNGYVDTYAVGFACVLLKVESLKKIPPPYFITGAHTTEDVYYCVKLRQHLPDAKILVDTNVPTGHILHPEVVHRDTRNKLVQYFSDPDKMEKLGGDRGKEYLAICKQALAKSNGYRQGDVIQEKG